MEFEGWDIVIISVPPTFRFTAHVYQALGEAVNSFVLISYKNHMRQAAPPTNEPTDSLFANSETFDLIV